MCSTTYFRTEIELTQSPAYSSIQPQHDHSLIIPTPVTDTDGYIQVTNAKHSNIEYEIPIPLNKWTLVIVDVAFKIIMKLFYFDLVNELVIQNWYVFYTPKAFVINDYLLYQVVATGIINLQCRWRVTVVCLCVFVLLIHPAGLSEYFNCNQQQQCVVVFQ